MTIAKRKTRTSDLESLVVIDKLEVGPVKVEPARLVMPYRVEQAGVVHEFDLIYRWEEPVFEPDQDWSINLASIIGAQVALNYGLFCKTIVFRGPFDNRDRSFLTEMAESTAREILVIKLLQPNPFLIGPAIGLRPRKQDKYLRAQLVFEGPGGNPERSKWERDPARIAVLSSGGKDSLLSYGLLREIGLEAHPIFVNESGRHWFTAVNAHRALAARDPLTARVWTNADRLFAWMLRRLPFVRQDFARIRSDEYPIRLWTVAVFLVGALPLLRKRHIGRLVIGDEYDTTIRKSFHGIAHYGGLYDQSRHFDRAMSRFFYGKGFDVSQFSVLRPLSEILIEKILAERYPDLLEQQVSCHASHKEGDRIHPCGRCEKCRRIVGMLLAVGADPAICGYKPDQNQEILDHLIRHGVHQEPVGAAQMGFMLRQRGLIQADHIGEVRIREQLQTLKLRFGAERSPFDAIPADLRPPLYRIFLEHAEGAVQRVGRLWQDFDPISSPDLHKPYTIERPQVNKPQERDPEADRGPRDYLLGELRWPQAKRRLAEVDLALLPVGAIEQHGPHLPLDTDAYDAEYLARLVAASCQAPRPLVLPLIPYGVSYHHDDFAGTISISPRALSQIVYEVGMSAARNRITKLVIINGHGGNTPALQFAAQMINSDAHIFTCVDTGETSDTDLARLTETEGDVHAGEIETSTSLATRPELVALDEAEACVPSFSSRYLDFSSKRSVEWYAHTSRISKSGVLGDPTKASAEKGRRMWQVMVANLVEFVEQLKGMSLEEIHQRKY